MSLNKMESASSSPLPPPPLQQIKEEEQDISGEVAVVSSLISSSLRTVHDTEDEEPRLQSAAPPTSDPPDGANNSNSNNSCCTPPLQASEEGWLSQHPPPEAATTPDPPKKRTKSGTRHGNVEVTLEGKNLWDEFYCRGTEMIVNRSGRRMFPGFSVAISGLKAKAKYTMKLEVILADNHRFKFLNARMAQPTKWVPAILDYMKKVKLIISTVVLASISNTTVRWLPVGTAEPQPLSGLYVHPDAPNSGAFWMRHGVSFRKMKITNNRERPAGNILLHSMHKYFLRLVVEEEHRPAPGEKKGPPKAILSTDFPETTFIAVTAYQNEEVTQLKICNNPFAKAFRENSADMDWETAQMLYGNQAAFSPVPQYNEQFGNHLVAPESWSMHSPILPPTPLTASLPSLSPLAAALTPHQTHSYYSPSPYHSNQCFQWPPNRSSHTSTQQELYAHSSYPPPPHPSTHPPPNPQPANLPDFASVFTPSLGPNST